MRRDHETAEHDQADQGDRQMDGHAGGAVPDGVQEDGHDVAEEEAEDRPTAVVGGSDPPQHGDRHAGPRDVTGGGEEGPKQQRLVDGGDATGQQSLEAVAHGLQRGEAHARRDADEDAAARVLRTPEEIQDHRDDELGALLDEADGHHRD